MTTLCFYHPDNEAHDPGKGHSERAARITAIVKALRALPDPTIVWKEPPLADRAALLLAHTPAYIDFVFMSVPASGYCPIEINEVTSDDDAGEVTVLCPRSGDAILRSVGGALQAVDEVVTGKADNAFCLTRPPGHHAMPDKAMGFCAVNNIALAARHAQKAHGLKRIAIVDFDVHHGNGTQAIFEKDTSVFFISLHQLPLWPESGHADEVGAGNILNIPFPPNTPREAWLTQWREKAMARLETEDFDLLLVSAGFDAHKDDPKGSQNLETEDYATLMRDLLDMAKRKCQGRLIALLEGGYDVEASAASAAAVMGVLAGQ
ncbi:MAG: histone deacetylase family protein [Bdellovibrionales bacterium]|jgi:acetoin utilization deacetylase AcuC-like enzyme